MKKKIVSLFIIGIFTMQGVQAKSNSLSSGKNIQVKEASTVVKTEVAPNQDGLKEARVQKVDLSFEQAYELMMANNNAIKACLEEIEAKKFEKKAAIGEFFPKIGLNATYAHLKDPVTVSTPNVHIGAMTIPVPDITLQDKNLFMANAGAVWNIFTGGRIIALNSAARARLEGTNEKYKDLTNTLTVKLVRSYYGLKLAQDVVKVRLQVLETTTKHLEDAKKLEAEGIIPMAERLHADVAYRQAKRDYNTSVRDVSIVEQSLKALIKADNADLNGIEIYPSSPLFLYNKDLEKLESFKDIAMKNNPKLKQIDMMKKLAQANYRNKVGSYMPTVSLFAYDVLASSTLSQQMPRFAVGATANWALFDGLSKYNNIKAADCVRRQVKYESIDAQNNIETLVTNNYEECLKFKEIYDSASTSMTSANEALRTSILAFKEGLGTSISVTDAQTALSGIKIQKLNALYNYDVMLTELLSTNGTAENILEYIKNSSKDQL